MIVVDNWIYTHCPLVIEQLAVESGGGYPFIVVNERIVVDNWIYTHCPLVINSELLKMVHR